MYKVCVLGDREFCSVVLANWQNNFRFWILDFGLEEGLIGSPHNLVPSPLSLLFGSSLNLKSKI